ncbi:MAG TPA: hypothetical protein VGS98_00490 [Thermoanaerobaculia bacterium]|jgi:hypothetical protein|nr:hypothetical protein [Thermoanaerobaculia bacterium]
MERRARLAFLAAAAVAIALVAVDCSRPARSETLHVTYYYLPG